MKRVTTGFAFLVSRQTEVTVPAWNEHHVIPEVFSLDLGFLKDDDIRLEHVEHGLAPVNKYRWPLFQA